MISLWKPAAPVIALLVFTAATPVHASTPAPVQSQSAAAFLDSFGINTHMGAASTGNLGTSYGNPTAIARELQYTGIKHVRDDLSIGSHLSALRQLNTLVGVKFDLCYAYYASDGGPTIITNDIANVQSSANMIEAIEGPNEPDWFGVYYDGTTGAPAITSSQEFLYSSVRASADLKDVPVFCPAFSYPAIWGLAGTVGNLGAYCDNAPLHAYPENLSLGGPYLPYEYIAQWASWPGTVTAVGKPVVITEGGWDTDTNGSTGVDEATQSKYISEYLLDAFSQGIRRTYLYELVDDAADPGMTAEEDHYGIFRFNGTPKPMATVIANLNAILRSGPVTPTALSYSVDNMPANGHQLLLEKSNGTFVLALWNEANLWDGTTHAEIPLATVQVLLNLGTPAASVQIFDPLLGTAMQQHYSNIQGLAVDIPDHPILVAVTPQN